MSRYLMLGNIKKTARSLITSQRLSHVEARKSGTIVAAGPLFHTKLFSHYGFLSRGHTSFPLHCTRRCFYPKGFGVFTARNIVKRHAQFVRKRFSYKFSSDSRTFPPINKAAQAFILAISRSYLILPGIFAFTCGELARAQRTVSNAGYYPSHDSFFVHAQDGHAFVVLLLHSTLEVMILLLRALYLAILFTPCIMMAPFVDTFGHSFRSLWLRVVHRSLENGGPAFIKWGQWAATRPDLFPRDLCAELSELQTKAPEHSFAYTKKTIERAFGRKLSDIFEKFEEKPVASGSIAQVYRAYLKFSYPGQLVKPMLVAIKVRHPGVGESIRRDFAIIDLVAKISKFIPTLRWLRLDESVQQFAVFMMSQVDLAREAAYLSRFIYNFRQWKDVSFPKPVYPLVHPAVLVETYEQGESVSHYVDELEGNERLKSALAHIGTHAFLKMLLVDNFIHADMHPGNILVRMPHEKSPRKRLFNNSKPHVIFLDVGMTAELSANDRINLLEFFKAVARWDGRTVAECTLRLSKQQNCPDPNAFIEEVTDAFAFWATPEADLVHPSETIQHLLEKVRRYRVNIDGNVCTAMVTTLVLEGWQRKLDPEYNVMQTLQTLLLRGDWAESLSYTIEGLMAP
ncbi:probable serine/threonine-protein kinase abkC isoform X2 [Cucurbita moschata]|uniref:Probable serine/threonine-protein kinase abkC isoform X2 n=1 Tax=Cucurbita moschata TaxID=3662 RepID=A0A6J1EFQ0_CUCMO|nr:probable serine/threonine-protein kinase abkC isoform X2 [Cucurbita moschata]